MSKRKQSEEKSMYPDDLETNTSAKQGVNCMFTMNKSSTFDPRTWFTEVCLGENDFAAQDIQFIVCQVEMGDETQREHIQGYCEFTKKKTFNQVKLAFNNNQMHIEWARNRAACTKYCQKADTRLKEAPFDEPFIAGVQKEPGKRNDLLDAAVKIANGATLKEIAKESPVTFIRNSRGLQQYQLLLSKPRMAQDIKIYWLWGGTRLGKSTYAHYRWGQNTEEYGDNEGKLYVATDKKEGWMDGYSGEPTILFDEFAGEHQLPQLLRLLDRHPYQAPIKGLFTNIRADTFIFTTNEKPENFYLGNIQYDAFMGRLRDFGKIVDVAHSTAVKAIIEKIKAANPRKEWHDELDERDDDVLCPATQEDPFAPEQ